MFVQVFCYVICVINVVAFVPSFFRLPLILLLRRGHEILRSVLPPKFEHVVFLRCSPVQRSLYDYCVLQAKEGSVAGGSGPLRAFAVCSKASQSLDCPC